MTNKENNIVIDTSSLPVEEKSANKKICFECNLSLSKSRHLININDPKPSNDRAAMETASDDVVKSWHSECFKCKICKLALDKEHSCFIYRDQIVCRDDYAKLRDRLNACGRCKYPLAASDWVRRVGQFFVYHLTCFTCDICLKELKTGDRFIIEEQEKRICNTDFETQHSETSFIDINNNNNDSKELGIERTRQMTQKSHLLMCESHFRKQSIADEPAKTNTDDRSEANQILGSGSKDQFPKEAEMQMGSGYCNTPPAPPPPRLMDYQNQVYESRSYDAKSSSSSLSNRAKSFYNNQTNAMHQQHPLHHHRQDHIIEPQSSPNGTQIIFEHNNQGHDLDDRDLMQMIDQHDQNSASSTSQCSGSNVDHRQGGMLMQSSGHQHHHNHHLSSSASKSKRVRTTFTEEQLSILQTHFQSDSNPDGQDLERIATITGLSKRVTQVWFQNSRARQKKYMIKRKPSAGHSGSCSTTPICSLGDKNISMLQMENPTCSTSSNNDQQNQHSELFNTMLDATEHLSSHNNIQQTEVLPNPSSLLVDTNAKHAADHLMRSKWSPATSNEDDDDDDDDDGDDEDDDLTEARMSIDDYEEEHEEDDNCTDGEDSDLEESNVTLENQVTSKENQKNMN